MKKTSLNGLYKTQRPSLKVPPEMHNHPIFNGPQSVGLITADNPSFPVSVQGGDEAMAKEMDRMGLKYEVTNGRYEKPEVSFIVHGPTRDQLSELGAKFGQESVIHTKNGNHEFIYVNGDKKGKFHPGLPGGEFFNTPPPDAWTEIPDKGYLRLHFDFDNTLDQPQTVSKQELGHALYNILKKATEEEVYDAPDAQYKEKVGVKFGTLPIRRLRDAIISEFPDKRSMSESDANKRGLGSFKAKKLMPQKGKPAVQLQPYELHADVLQQHLDGLPIDIHYNVSHINYPNGGDGFWPELKSAMDAHMPSMYGPGWDSPQLIPGGPQDWSGSLTSQRHNDDHTKVFQINLTNDMIDHLKASDHWNFYKHVWDKNNAATHGLHPARKYHGIGWVRWTGDPQKNKEAFIDEIQADLPGRLRSKGEQDGAELGMDRQEIKQAVDNIIHTLYGGKSAPEAVAESYMQWLRDAGHGGIKLAMHDKDSKARIALPNYTTKAKPDALRMEYEEDKDYMDRMRAHLGVAANDPLEGYYHPIAPKKDSNGNPVYILDAQGNKQPDLMVRQGLSGIPPPQWLSDIYQSIPEKLLRWAPSKYSKDQMKTMNNPNLQGRGIWAGTLLKHLKWTPNGTDLRDSDGDLMGDSNGLTEVARDLLKSMFETRANLTVVKSEGTMATELSRNEIAQSLKEMIERRIAEYSTELADLQKREGKLSKSDLACVLCGKGADCGCSLSKGEDSEEASVNEESGEESEESSSAGERSSSEESSDWDEFSKSELLTPETLALEKALLVNDYSKEGMERAKKIAEEKKREEDKKEDKKDKKPLSKVVLKENPREQPAGIKSSFSNPAVSEKALTGLDKIKAAAQHTQLGHGQTGLGAKPSNAAASAQVVRPAPARPGIFGRLLGKEELHPSNQPIGKPVIPVIPGTKTPKMVKDELTPPLDKQPGKLPGMPKKVPQSKEGIGGDVKKDKMAKAAPTASAATPAVPKPSAPATPSAKPPTAAPAPKMSATPAPTAAPKGGTSPATQTPANPK